jgi:hypothetical protein
MDASVDEQQGGASTTKERRRAGPTKSVAAQEISLEWHRRAGREWGRVRKGGKER